MGNRTKYETKNAVIMLAWPQTPAIQVGSWYEGLMKLLGFNKNGYYMAGHSAIVLVEPKTGHLNYFDFGRYHAPVGHGRVRDKITDPDLNLEKKAQVNSKGEIVNLNELLKTIAANHKAFHGKGKMYASINYQIDYKKAYAHAKFLQNRGAIPYGPFELGGTNCSRFTSMVYRAGTTNRFTKLRLLFPTSLTPTTIGNVLAIANNNQFYTVDKQELIKHTATTDQQLKNWILPSFLTKKRASKVKNTENSVVKELIKI